MLFNSIDFAFFLPIIFFLYWIFNKNLKLQNFIIVISSYIFYGWWDWRFLLLIVFSTLVDYSVGQGLLNNNNQWKRKLLLWTSISVNLGLLAFFKYYNFFLYNFITAFSFLGANIKPGALNIILPVGISFYTFQTLSYSIDVYKQKLKPTKDLIAFSAFVSFFPQLVAGPIERATHLLPQFETNRKFNYSKSIDGIKQILWGLFKKIVIADNCATFVNLIFDNSTEYSGSTLLLGSVLFCFQIYGDFSGYSDIAIGVARLFGFNLRQNFAFPYFSRNFNEFWKKWHISLSSWFRDYLFIPLVKSGKINAWTKIKNIVILFIITGFWHGANWTFIFWGFLHALLFISTIFTKKKYKSIIPAKGKNLPSCREALDILKTFFLFAFTLIIFRANTIKHAYDYISDIFSSTLFVIDKHIISPNLIFTVQIILFFIIIEWYGRESKYAIEKLGSKWKPFFRYSYYYFIVFLILFYGGQTQQFIYFQF